MIVTTKRDGTPTILYMQNKQENSDLLSIIFTLKTIDGTRRKTPDV